MSRFGRFSVVIAIIALIVVACSSTGGGTATSGAAEGDTTVEFGRGSVPRTVPESFPIPEEAVIGATLIDGNRGVTEFVMTLPASLPAAVDYYTKNLPIAGYELTSSGGSETDWEIIFLDTDLHGVVGIKAKGDGLSAVSVQLTDS